MLITLALSVSLLPLDPPDNEIPRQVQCANVCEMCCNEVIEDYLAGVIDGPQFLERWDTCLDWFFECRELAHLLDAIDGQFPLVPGTIIFPPYCPSGD